MKGRLRLDLKLSISILVSSAYFLTLFLFKLLKTSDILGTLVNSAMYSFIIFIIVYALAIYISIVFENLKKKEANDAIAKIKQLEEEQMAKRTEALKNKYSEIDKAILEKEKARVSNIYSEEDDEENETLNTTNTAKSNTTDKQDIEKLKKESGTQFDPSFSVENIQI